MRSKGYRSGTRRLFSKGFRKHGMPSVTKYTQVYKMKQYVDVIVDPAVHKGMPYKFYHGKTGSIFNVNPRSVTVLMSKQSGPKMISRKIVARVEHIRPSKCCDDFLMRRKINDENARMAAENGEKIGPQKRAPVGARDEVFVECGENEIVELKNKPFYVSY